MRFKKGDKVFDKQRQMRGKVHRSYPVEDKRYSYYLVNFIKERDKLYVVNGKHLVKYY